MRPMVPKERAAKPKTWPSLVVTRMRAKKTAQTVVRARRLDGRDWRKGILRVRMT